MRTDQQKYLDRNAKGYEGDEFIHTEIKKLVEKFAVDEIIETGSFKGATTKRLSELAYTRSCEIMPENFIDAVNFNEKNNRAEIFLQDSIEFLKSITPLPGDSVLFFLDAHWWDSCPLLAELDAIRDMRISPVIVIHDFKVPGRPDLGFDSYKGQCFTFDWIKPSIDAIYGPNGYDFHYNSQSEGAKRGVIYIYPKV